MQQFIATVAFLLVVVPVSQADDKSDAAKKLEGTYKLVALSINGKPNGKKLDGFESLVIKDSTITIQDGKSTEMAMFTLDPSKKPAHIDLTPKGENKIIKGIYEAKETEKGLELILTFSKDETSERPTDFKGAEGVTVMTLLRKKEK